MQNPNQDHKWNCAANVNWWKKVTNFNYYGSLVTENFRSDREI